jgi:hypothetical protein
VSSLLVLAAFAVSAAAQTTESWTDKISVSGDLRVRHEYISKNKAVDNAAVHRERYRARVAVKGKVNESVVANVRLASTDNANPISTNSTFTDNASKKSIYVDIASIDWKMCEKGQVVLGKQENGLRPIKRSQLVYDDDYTPEGIYIGTDSTIFTKVGAFSIQERSQQADGTSEPDSWLLAGMAGVRTDLGSNSSFTAGLGYHDFTALKKNATLNGGFLGNSESGARYVHDYQVGEALAEMKWKLSGAALTVFADYIFNFGADENNTGLAAGAEYKTLDDQGQPLWIASYTYQTNGKDSTVSAINHSDINNGHDGGFGHILTLGRTVATNTLAHVTYYHGQIDNSGNPYWIDRVQADIGVSF